MMIIGIATFAAAVLLAFAVFYLIVRIKDLDSRLKGLGEAMPVSDEMRRSATSTIESLNQRIGTLNQKAEQIRTIADEVASLKNLFVQPKGAGGAGERLLEKALHDILPSSMFQAQYRLSAGVVDLAILLKENIVPIDSKLSLEDFRKMLGAKDDGERKTHWRAFTAAIKKRIDETSKYILPGERTTDFAMMYIASESAYYEAFIKDEQFGEPNSLLDYAFKRNVYPTSPQTIQPYLMTIVQGMKALKIEENAKEILGKVAGLRTDFERFKLIYSQLIIHLTNARKKHDEEGQTAMTKLDQHISALEQRSGS